MISLPSRRLISLVASGGYQLKRELAFGGMGVVYEAEQIASKRDVALKMMRGFFFAHDEDIARFRTEAEAVARLDHTHIVPIYDIGEESQQPFFTMKSWKAEAWPSV